MKKERSEVGKMIDDLSPHIPDFWKAFSYRCVKVISKNPKLDKMNKIQLMKMVAGSKVKLLPTPKQKKGS